ncbi:hypothetical protein [Asaia bogorensis]|uniref:hypothetical protein n=1 Tax=Asaia bogorensis TaxID=91915 RepID=UPI000EFD74F3|nr:hypothetical protein [Asaia bogorensis]
MASVYLCRYSRLGATFTDLIFAHLQRVGQSVGLTVRMDCRDKQLFVFFTDQSDRLAQKIEADNPDMFIGYESSPVYRDRKVLASRKERQEFLKPRAIRWLAASAIRSVNDEPYEAFQGPTGVIYVAVSTAPSFLNDTPRRDLSIAVIIVDPDRLRNESWSGLGDLIALMGFTAPHLREGYDEASILQLTQGPVLQGPSGGMTRYDRVVLKALYALPEGYDQTEGFDWMVDRLCSDHQHR